MRALAHEHFLTWPAGGSVAGRASPQVWRLWGLVEGRWRSIRDSDQPPVTRARVTGDGAGRVFTQDLSGIDIKSDGKWCTDTWSSASVCFSASRSL